MQIRTATALDAPLIAALHAASWRSAYRGAMSDEYLAADVVADRLALWSKRLGTPNERQHVVVAQASDQIAGFGCVYANDDPRWGSLLDNLHVEQSFHRAGVGTRILRNIAAWCAIAAPHAPLYLWVLETNVGAQAFYRNLGASGVGSDIWAPPGGGSARRYRFAWERPHDLLQHGAS
jgi:GNAT superfamily N-acetyltransferase